MKYCILVILLSVGFSVSAGHFKIRGHINGYNSGKIYVISSMTMDTLAQSLVSDGFFKLKGHTTEPQAAYIRTDSLFEGPVFFLENTSYQMSLQTKSSFHADIHGHELSIRELDNELYSNIEGGDDQQIANQFWDLLISAQQLFNNIQTESDNHSRQQASSINETQNASNEEEVRLHTLSKAQQLLAIHSNSQVCTYVVSEYLIDLCENKEEMENLYGQLSAQVSNSPYGLKIAQRIKYTDYIPQLNDTMPAFQLTTTDNTGIQLKDFNGQIKILNFWAGYCNPCMQEMPQLQQLHKQYVTQDVQIINITTDKDPKIAQQLRHLLPGRWIQAGFFRTTDTDLNSMFHINMLPFRIILDHNNRIVAQGPVSIQQTQKIIESLLAQ